MPWSPILSADRGPLQTAPDASLGRADARAVWACATGFRGYRRRGGPGPPATLPVALQINPSATVGQRNALAAWVDLPPAYDRANDNFWTGVVASNRVADVAMHGAVLRWCFGVPQAAAGGPGGATVAPGGPVQGLVRVATSADPALPVIGIIDHGIAFVHRCFRDPAASGSTRVLALWSQDPQQQAAIGGGKWSSPRGFGYGGELLGPVIDAEIAARGDDEFALYHALGYTPVLFPGSHGTHVLDVAAGFPNPLRPLRGAAAAPGLGAGHAPIIAVQLPYQPAKDASGASHAVHILDALRYIVGRAPASRPVVINLSDGAYGGAHDGRALLESAIDDFLARNPHVHLVLAAGNAHEERLHAAGPVAGLAPGQRCGFDWRVLPDDPTDSFIEIWLGAEVGSGQVLLHVTPPGGAAAQTVDVGDRAALRIPAQAQPVGAALSAARSALPADPPRITATPGRTAYTLALGGTRGVPGGADAAPHGIWRIEVENVGAPALGVDAWVERDDPVLNDRTQRRQSRIDRHRLSGVTISGERTLGSIAGCRQAIVVGARYARGQAFSGERPSAGAMTAETRYSSRGPGRAAGAAVDAPDLLAAGDESPVAAGWLAAGNRSGTVFRMNGTSVAAPIVTRRIVTLLCATPGLGRDAIRAQLAVAPPAAGADP